MMSDVSGHVVIFLVDMTVEHSNIFEGHQQIDRFLTIFRGPIPLRIKIKERSVRQYYDIRVRRLAGQICL